ncbi:Wzz/FepE/Etk N-terminal domain-containing protein [Mycolicibacterium novocastrense]|nr:Wzz/FepE/Etk N-terminal domain-containing protein [Mycolicibacterium novocastrense]
MRTRWKIICATTVIAMLGALAYSLTIAPMYEASTRLFVSTTSEGNNSEIYDGGLFAESRVLSYIELLEGELLAQRTIDKLGLDMDVAELQGEVKVSSPPTPSSSTWKCPTGQRFAPEISPTRCPTSSSSWRPHSKRQGWACHQMRG